LEFPLKLRSFLTAAAATFSFAVAERFASALESHTVATSKIYVVHAHDDRFGEIHGPGYIRA
jgi:hypothetical protein